MALAVAVDKNIVTETCERVLVTLLSNLGPWNKSVYLVGGLTPRYLVQKLAPGKAPHAGTGDVDIVVHLEMLTETEAYRTFEKNLKNMGFERGENDEGQKVNWRWRTKSEEGITIILELLTEDPQQEAKGQVRPLPVKGNVSALHIQHAAMVIDHHQVIEVSARLLNSEAIAVQNVRFADIVAFICLKAYACDQRQKAKDAYDLVFCLENAPGGLEAVAKAFQATREGKYQGVIVEVLDILRRHFASDKHASGYLKSGPVAVVQYEQIEGRDERMVRQRQVSSIVEKLLVLVG